MLHTDNSVSTYLAFGIVFKLFVGIWNRCREQITGCLITLVLRILKLKTRYVLRKQRRKWFYLRTAFDNGREEEGSVYMFS
jgi:hypothetical protein